MGSAGKLVSTVMMVAVLTVVMAASTTEAQPLPPLPPCTKKLVPCAGFLNATIKPTPACCNPLKEAMTKELPCLCKIFKDQNLMKTFNVKVEQALKLVQQCAIPGDMNTCNTVPPGATSPKPPPATPGGGHNGVAGTPPATAFPSLLVMAAAI